MIAETAARADRIALAAVLLAVLCAAAGGCASSPRQSSPIVSRSPGRPSPSSTPSGPYVVGLGDSVVTGFHCGCAGPVPAYAALLARRAGRPVGAVDLGANGGTTTTLLGQLAEPATRSALRRAAAVVVIAGANDLVPQRDTFRSSGCGYACFHPAVEAMGSRLGRVLDTIASIRGGRRASVLVADYWNVFLDGDDAVAAHGEDEVLWGRRVSRDANAAICRATAAAGGTCVDTYAPFLAHGDDPSRYLAADGDHPDAAGVALIASRLAAATPAGVLASLR